jgi:hypothetical protein
MYIYLWISYEQKATLDKWLLTNRLDITDLKKLSTQTNITKQWSLLNISFIEGSISLHCLFFPKIITNHTCMAFQLCLFCLTIEKGDPNLLQPLFRVLILNKLLLYKKQFVSLDLQVRYFHYFFETRNDTCCPILSWQRQSQ